jgi:hypothetical protein
LAGSHKDAAGEARALVSEHDGHAKTLDQGDIDEVLRLDQVRREIQRVYDREGE